jgi:hypothetical protein
MMTFHFRDGIAQGDCVWIDVAALDGESVWVELDIGDETDRTWALSIAEPGRTR